MNAWVNLAIVIGLFAGAWACRRIARRIMNRNLKAGDRPLCGKCKFDLSGTLAIDRQGDAKPPNLGGVCPECGADVSKPWAVVKANDHALIEALRMPVPVMMIVAAVVLCAAFRPHKANYAKPLPNSMLVWLLRNDVISENGRYELVRRIRDPKRVSDATISELLPSAVAASKEKSIAPIDPWIAIVSEAAIRDLLETVELPGHFMTSVQLVDAPDSRDAIYAERQITANLGTGAVWSPVSATIGGFPALVRAGYGRLNDGYVVLADQRVTDTSVRVDMNIRWGLWNFWNPTPRIAVFSAPATSTTQILPARPVALPFVDCGCDTSFAAVSVYEMRVAPVLDQRGVRSVQVVDMTIFESLSIPNRTEPNARASAAVRISMIADDGTKYPLAVAVVAAPTDRSTLPTRSAFPVFWSLHELTPEASAFIQSRTLVRVAIESDEELERAFLPGGPVWRGSVMRLVEVIPFSAGSTGNWQFIR